MEYVLGLGAFAGAVAILFVVIRTAARRLFGRGRRLERELALRLLSERLQRGEVSIEQHDEAKAALGRD